MSSEELPEIEVFKNALADDDIEVEKGAAYSLASVALLFGEEKTRNDLLPFLYEHINNITEEVQIIIAEQLGKYLPLIGGEQNSGVLLQILTRLCLSDETLVREQAEQSIKIIARELSSESCENFYIPLIHDLAHGSWFSVKCSASALIEVCYWKASEQSKTDLRCEFRNLIQDENPLVRKTAALNLIDFLKVLEPEHVNLEFVPVLDNIKQDMQDNVKPLAVDIGIAIAKIIQNTEIDDHVLSIIEEFGNDESWKIRHKVASTLPEIQLTFGACKDRGKILSIFQRVTTDTENEVKIAAAENLFDYCEAFKQSYDNSNAENNFEAVFVQSIVPHIRHLLEDFFEDIVLSTTTSMLRLSAIISTECFKANILPLIIELLESEETRQSVKENILKNLNAIPVGINITDYIKSFEVVINGLLNDSKLHWRTRRNLLLFFIHIANYCTKEYFDTKLKYFYRALIGDSIFAVRRTASIILPLLAKSFGMQWAISSLIPIFLDYASSEKYLFRYITVTSINEIVFPTVEKDCTENNTNYLDYFKQYNQGKTLHTLGRIEILNRKLLAELASETCSAFLNDCDGYNASSESVKIYTEDTLDVFKKNKKDQIFSVEEKECGPEDISYLEGVLLLCNKQYLTILKKLCADPTYNVQIKAKQALNNIKIFAEKIDQEIHDSWVQECLKKLTSEDIVKIDEQVKEKLKNIVDLSSKIQPMDIDNMEIKNIDENLIITSGEEPLPDLRNEVLDLEINNDQKTETEHVETLVIVNSNEKSKPETEVEETNNPTTTNVEQNKESEPEKPSVVSDTDCDCEKENNGATNSETTTKETSEIVPDKSENDNEHAKKSETSEGDS